MKLQVSVLLALVCCALASQRHPQPSDIIYYLYTRSNQDDGSVINYTDNSINSYFNGSKMTSVVVHGFSECVSTSSWMPAVKNLILAKEDANVILVEWSILAAEPLYERAVHNTFYTGEDLSFLMHDLSDRGGLSPSNVHLIGFSLGAQAVAVTGNKYGIVGRITGLDPAKPLFEHKPLSDTLDKGDAKFVDVIHTNSGHLTTGHLSFADDLGHIDFYPNGGHDQRGCPLLMKDVGENLINLTLDDINACSHGRAPAYFIRSLQNSDFIGYKCSSYKNYQNGLCTSDTNILGWDVNKNNGGTFFMETLTGQPFVASQIKAEFAIETSTRGSLMLRNTIPGEVQDKFEIFGGVKSVHSGSIITKIITASTDGVTAMAIELEYDAGILGPRNLNISSINSIDIKSGAKACIGKNLKLPSGQKVAISPTSGPC